MTEAEWVAFLQRPEIPAFNRAMLENPADDLPRLVFADWMEENHPNRRFVRQLRLSVSRRDDVLHCPTFPELRGVKPGIWRGRLVLGFVPVAGVEVRLRREERSFLRAVVASGWLGRVAVWIHKRGEEPVSPEFVAAIRWQEIEWLEIGGSIDWKPALGEFVLSHPARFPKLFALVHLDVTPTGVTLEEWFASPLLQQLTHLDLGFGSRWLEVAETIQRSPHLTPEWKARLLR